METRDLPSRQIKKQEKNEFMARPGDTWPLWARPELPQGLPIWQKSTSRDLESLLECLSDWQWLIWQFLTHPWWFLTQLRGKFEFLKTVLVSLKKTVKLEAQFYKVTWFPNPFRRRWVPSKNDNKRFPRLLTTRFALVGPINLTWRHCKRRDVTWFLAILSEMKFTNFVSIFSCFIVCFVTSFFQDLLA